jgi:hypothetical protein
MSTHDQPDRTAAAAMPGRHLAWLVVLAALLAYQGWMTLGLFGPDQPWQRLRDDGPILSGRHALHLYHGYLGAQSLLERGTLSCYDPAFHAGYPKTPVFDGGSRPGELALALGGARFSPAAYKVGLAVLCLLVPLLVYVAGRGAGLSRGTAVLAVALALAAWWGKPGRESLEAGDGDLLLAALLALAQAGLLLRWHACAGLLGLAGVVLCGLAGWFAQPLLMLVLSPLFLVYYVSAGPRHRLAWHLPLLGGLLAGVAGNAFWLCDWVSYWWVRVPPGLEAGTHPGLAELWDAPLWGSSADRIFVVLVAALAVVGCAALYRNGARLAARLVGLAVLGLFALVVAGTRSHVLGRLGACQLLVPALLFASVPAAFAVAWALERLRRGSGNVLVPLAVLAIAPFLVWLVVPVQAGAWAQRLAGPEPLQIGLGDDRAALVESLRESTSDVARILWEDRKGPRREPRWTALLPVLTGRSFVGGLDDGAGIEHATSGLMEGALAGRRLHDWSDTELVDYCRRYNVGWIVCGSAAARDRFERWRAAGTPRALPVTGEGERRLLFRIDRQPSFALAGSVQWRSADVRGILLADAVPAQPGPGETEGQVVLSLHYQAGMRVRPSRVKLEQAVDSQDAIPFVRLRMREPVGTILITWDSR